MALPDEWGVSLAVLGLVSALLALAAMHHRYLANQVKVRAVVRQIESCLLPVSSALGDLRSVPLSRELRVLLRADVLGRYRRIARLYRRYPMIRQRIAEAETALRAEGEPPGSGVGAIDGEQTFRRLSAALDALLDVIRHGATLQPIPRDVREIFVRELGERRAEVLSRFHLVEARRLETAGNITKGRAHLTTLGHQLRRSCPSTPFVRALYEEAEQALIAIGQRTAEEDTVGALGKRKPGYGLQTG